MKLKQTVEEAWDNRELLSKDYVQNAILEVIDQLDRGILRVAEKQPSGWKVNDWVKKAVILYFPIQKNGDHRGTAI